MSNNMHYTYIYTYIYIYTTYRCRVLDVVDVFTGEMCEDVGNLEDVWRKTVKTTTW
jgi:hypothetical protein